MVRIASGSLPTTSRCLMLSVARFSFLVVLLACFPDTVRCQTPTDPADARPLPATPPLTADAYVPVTAAQRVDWIVDGTVGRQSLTIVGPLATAWQTGFNTPEEWGRG